MKSMFVLTYRWIDIETKWDVTELFSSLDKAEAERDKLTKDELERKVFDPGSIGKLEITIDRYNYDVECSKTYV